jgi:hypothetical protein
VRPSQSPQLGYARVSTEHQSLDQQTDALAAAGVESDRVYSYKLSGASTRQQRPALPHSWITHAKAMPSWLPVSTGWAALQPRS